MIVVYLAAIVLANLTVAWFGPWWAPVNAALLIGLDLTARDTLHDRWHHRGLIWKMGLLIGVGGLISYLLNADAAQIAIASTVAFTFAAISDGLVYALAADLDRLWRVNLSNTVGAAVDSVLFALIAFGTFGWLTFWLFVAKVGGGFVWSLILRRDRAVARTQGA